MEAACRRETSLTSVSTAVRLSEAPITYADTSSFTQVSYCADFHCDAHIFSSICLSNDDKSSISTTKETVDVIMTLAEETKTIVVITAFTVYPTLSSDVTLCTWSTVVCSSLSIIVLVQFCTLFLVLQAVTDTYIVLDIRMADVGIPGEC